jgi:hypothetical protein
MLRKNFLRVRANVRGELNCKVPAEVVPAAPEMRLTFRNALT